MKSRQIVSLLFVLTVFLSPNSVTSATGPEPFPNGLILQGPYLFCGDTEGMFHILYDDLPLIHGIGIYSGINGYTKPNDMEKVEYQRGIGEVSYQGKVRGTGVGIEQSAAIAGNRIRVRIKRTGVWPKDTWGNVQIAFPVSQYGGAGFTADGVKGVFPKEYSAGNKLPGGMKRLEFKTGEPRLNIVLECVDGISIEDHRRFDNPSYMVGIDLPKEGRDSVEFFFTLPDLSSLPPRRALRWSRIGYPVRGEKVAIMEWPKNAPRPGDAAKVVNRDGKTVKEGVFGPTSAVDYMQNNYATFDFTDVREPGEYRVTWAGGGTGWFPIRESVFTDRLWEKTLDNFIPFEMCHAAVDLGPGIPAHGACHKDDAARVPANHTGPDGFFSYEAEGTPYKSGEHIPVATGGWHDAGDFDLNVPAQSYVAWMLALAWEEFRPSRDVATLDAGAKTFRAGKPDGTPDILQQVEWGALWLLSVQQKDGRVYNGVCDKPAQRSGKPLETITDGIPGNDDDRLLYVDYHADQQLNHVIAMAAASRALKQARPGLAKKCLESARKGFKYFQTHQEVYRRGSYTATQVKGKERDGSVISAAVELFLTTGDKAYLKIVEGLAGSLPELKFEWPLPRETGTGGFRYAPPFLARLAPRLPEGKLKAVVVETCRRAAKMDADRMAIRPWPLETWEYGLWGNNGTHLARAFDTYWLTRVAPEVLPPEKALRSMLWIFGMHPVCDTVFVAGLGFPETKYLYNCHLHAVNGTGSGNIPGAVIPGMGGFWESGVVTYIDEYGYYGHNEACIYTSAQYIFAVNAMRAMGY
jgi:hypothetical protein